MKSFNPKARVRVLYAAPLAIASSALAISLIAPQIARASTSNLTAVSPEQLVSWIQTAHPVSLNGTVTGTTSFPIPSASLLGGSDPQSILGGSTTETYNVWANGIGSFRSQQVTSAGETDLYVSPGSVWYWNSNTLTATNEKASGTAPTESPSVSNPQLSATSVVDKLSAYSTLSVSGNEMVAGRPAYTLSLTPIASDSLIGVVNIAIDGQTHVPVAIQVFPKGSNTPAASLGFDTLTFAPQPSSIFAFTPPAGAKVVEGGSGAGGTNATSGDGSVSSGTKVVGSGFDSVLVATLSSKQLSALAGIEKALPTIATPVGIGHLYSNPVFQAIVLPDGTVVAGAVDTARLLQVVAGL